MSGPKPSSRGFGSRESRCVLELLALTGFAVTQPLLSVFGRSPDEFIFRNSSGTDVVLFALVITLVPTMGLWLGELAIGALSTRARRGVHVAIVAGLVAIFALQAVKKATGLRGVSLVGLSAAIGVAAALLYLRASVARLWLWLASPAPVVFALLFVLTSPVSNLVFASEAHAARLGSAGNAPSVVMVTFDEWPTASIVDAQGHIDATVFPHLAALGRDSTWYRNATSITSSTWFAVPTILTGKYPKDGELPEASSHPESVFTFLGGTYRLDAFETVTRVCPPSLCRPPRVGGSSGLRALLADARTTYRKMVSPHTGNSDITTGFEERETKAAVNEARRATGPNQQVTEDLGAAATNQPERFQQFLDSLHANEKPTLHFLHILLPHVPYRYLPSGLQYPSPVADFGKSNDTWTDQSWPPALARQRMLLQAAYVDRLVGELIAGLKAKGLYDRSVVVITADHGIAFTPGGPARGLIDRPVDASIYPQLLWAPLIVKASGHTQGAVSDANVMSIDVLPTIAKLIGFKIPWKVDGVPAGERTGKEKIFAKATHNTYGARLGPQVRYDGTLGEQQMLAGNIDAITAPGDPASRLWRVGPDGALVGRRLDSFTIGSRSGVTAQLHQLDELKHLNAATGSAPALLWGQADGAARIAIAINGTIGGLSPTFRDGDVPNRFAAMVPDGSLKKGANQVLLFEVTGDAAQPVLRPITVTGGD